MPNQYLAGKLTVFDGIKLTKLLTAGRMKINGLHDGFVAAFQSVRISAYSGTYKPEPCIRAVLTELSMNRPVASSFEVVRLRTIDHHQHRHNH